MVDLREHLKNRRVQHYCIPAAWFCCSGRIPRLSLNQHSLYVGVGAVRRYGAEIS